METTPEQAAEGVAVVRVLAAVLERLVCANTSLAITDPGQVTKFHALKAPAIGILQYLERIHKYASCSNECFILALIYVDRLIQRNNFLLTELNVHRVVITSILLAAKFFDDAYYNNAYYAKVGGVLVSEMNGLEVDFLFRINFSLHVTPDLFHKYREELLSHSHGVIMNSQVELMQAVTRQDIFPAVPQTDMTAKMIHESNHDNKRQSQLPPEYTATDRLPIYITPSPPTTFAQNSALPLSGSDMMPTVQSTIPDAAQTEPLPSYLLRAKAALQMPTFPVVQHRCSPQGSFPSVAAAAAADGSALIPPAFTGSEHYLVIDSLAYPFHQTLIHHNHAVGADVGLQHNFSHGYQARQQNDTAAFMNANTMICCDVGGTQYYMGGQILTGCSSGS